MHMKRAKIQYTYYPLRKTLENQAKKQVDASKSSNKIYELEQIESIFPKNQFYDLIIDKLKENVSLQNNIKLDDPEYTAKSGKHYNFTKYSVPFDF